jgi:hypothetical protein
VTTYVRGNPSKHDIDRFVDHVRSLDLFRGSPAELAATEAEVRTMLLYLNVGSLRKWADRSAASFVNRFGGTLTEVLDPNFPNDEFATVLVDYVAEHVRNAVRAAVYEHLGWEAPDEGRPARSSPGYEVKEGHDEPSDVTGQP